jgi:thioredoxin 1
METKMSTTITSVSADNFEEEILKSERPVIVQFSTDTCLPCKKLKTIVDSLASEYSDRVKICSIDAAKEYSLALEYKIVSVPTLIYFKDGSVVSKSVGLVSKQAIVDQIEGFTKIG